MTVTAYRVFLASHFEEFSELRRRLVERIHGHPGVPMLAISFDDERPRSSTPLVESLEAARGCDVMVLLVGREYGSRPPGRKRSFTHLEHEAALTAVPAPVIRVFRVKSADDSHTLDPALAAWLTEIERLHTVAPLWTHKDEDQLAREICEAVVGVLFEVLSGTQREQLASADLQDGLGKLEWSAADAEQLAFLERRSGAARTFGQEGDELASPDDLLRHPARVAALEQRQEAFKALELGERSTAIVHFRRALEHRPLDLESSFWLARLLSTTGRRKDGQEAVTLALRAARIARDESRPIRAAAAYVIAARASAHLGDHEQSLQLAREAVEHADWYADAHCELACALARRGEIEEALDAARSAFFLYPLSFRRLQHDPAFQHHTDALSRLEKRLRERVKSVVTEILQVQAEVDGEAPREVAADRLLDLVNEGRRAAQTLHERLADEAGALRQNNRELEDEKQRLRELRDQVTAREDQERPELVAAKPGFPVGSTTAFGFIVVLLLFIAFMDSTNNLSTASGVLALFLAALGLFTVLSWHRKHRDWKERLDEADRTFDHAIAEIDMNEKRRAASYEEFRLHAGRRFERRVVAFEEAALRWAILSPSRSSHGAKSGDLVRLGAEVPEGWSVDENPLPLDLRDDLEREPLALPKQSLYRFVNSHGQPLAARWGAYVQVKPTTSPQTD